MPRMEIADHNWTPENAAELLSRAEHLWINRWGTIRLGVPVQDGVEAVYAFHLPDARNPDNVVAITLYNRLHDDYRANWQPYSHEEGWGDICVRREPDPDAYYTAHERATEQRLDDQQAEDAERGDEWNSPRYETPRPRK